MNARKIRRLCILLFAVTGVACSLFSSKTYAYTGLTDSNGIESVFCNIALIITDTTGKCLGTVGIIGLGIGACFGKVSWNTAMLSVLSIGVVFGSASIVAELGDDGFTLIVGASPSMPDPSDPRAIGSPTSGDAGPEAGLPTSTGSAGAASGGSECSAGALAAK